MTWLLLLTLHCSGLRRNTNHRRHCRSTSVRYPCQSFNPKHRRPNHAHKSQTSLDLAYNRPAPLLTGQADDRILLNLDQVPNQVLAQDEMTDRVFAQDETTDLVLAQDEMTDQSPAQGGTTDQVPDRDATTGQIGPPC